MPVVARFRRCVIVGRDRDDGCVVVGMDNSAGRPTAHGRAVLRSARASAQRAEHVFLFAHVPLIARRPDGHVPRARIETEAARSLPDVRAELGCDIDVVFAAHTDEWAQWRDECGTLHVTCGAEPGLGWPEVWRYAAAPVGAALMMVQLVLGGVARLALAPETGREPGPPTGL